MRPAVQFCERLDIEGIIGAVPYLGDAFDVAFRADRRNVRLLRDHFDGRA